MAKEKEAPQRRSGEEGGYPDVRFDAEKRLVFHLDANGAKVYHGVPDGWEWTAAGVMQPSKKE